MGVWFSILSAGVMKVRSFIGARLILLFTRNVIAQEPALVLCVRRPFLPPKTATPSQNSFNPQESSVPAYFPRSKHPSNCSRVRHRFARGAIPHRFHESAVGPAGLSSSPAFVFRAAKESVTRRTQEWLWRSVESLPDAGCGRNGDGGRKHFPQR